MPWGLPELLIPEEMWFYPLTAGLLLLIDVDPTALAVEFVAGFVTDLIPFFYL